MNSMSSCEGDAVRLANHASLSSGDISDHVFEVGSRFAVARALRMLIFGAGR